MEIANKSLDEAKPFYDKIEIFDNQSMFQYAEKETTFIEAFKEMGIFNSKVAHKFRDHILSSGGSEHPSILYRKFRGKDATIDALLNRAGLIQDQKINSKS